MENTKRTRGEQCGISKERERERTKYSSHIRAHYCPAVVIQLFKSLLSCGKWLSGFSVNRNLLQMTKLTSCLMVFLPLNGHTRKFSSTRGMLFLLLDGSLIKMYFFNCPCFSALWCSSVWQKQAVLRKSFVFLKQHKMSSISQVQWHSSFNCPWQESNLS